MGADEGFSGGWLPGLVLAGLLGIGVALTWWAAPRSSADAPPPGPSVAAPSDATAPPAVQVASPAPADPERPHTVAAPVPEPSLRARTEAFLASDLTFAVVGDPGEDAEDAAMALAFQQRAATYATLSEDLLVSGTAEDLADLAAIHLAFADDLASSVAPSYLTPEQAASYTAQLAAKAESLREQAADAVDRARRAGTPTPALEARLDGLSQRLAQGR